jgi:hypothetical protein
MKKTPRVIGLYQALGLTSYVSLVSLTMSQGSKIFGEVDNKILAPILFLSLFSTSALICALITLGYPLIVFLDKKNTREAVMIVGYTAGWMVGIVLIIMLALIVW